MQLTFLEPLLDRRGPWATVYFNPVQRDEWGIIRRGLLVREACQTLEDEGADPATVQAVHDALTDVTPQENPAGLVLFAAGGEVALTWRLSRPPQGPIAYWAPLPRLTPLLELAGQDPLCLVAYVDRTGADFELRGAAGPKDFGSVEGRQSPVHRTASGDWSQRHFQLKVENTWEHNAGEIAEALASAYEESGAELVVLVGDVRERPAVLERLPEPVREVTVATEHGGRAPGSSSPALEEAIEQARQEHAHRRVEKALDRFRAGRSETGSRADAVEGVPALVEAAQEHRIDTLLVRPDGLELTIETWVGAAPDQVTVRRADAETLGEVDPVAVRADDALLRAAAATAADVLFVPPADVEEPDVPAGGLGALLRWAQEPSAA
ncbi:Vms1/Ankzf1 family peptidyl-tRNA hydrolase [Streptomyces sp. NPDC056580]|uniref:baeRF2 domain-containing protein n=1 Tax=Streptomyces sp. NPDC056580 TaxID=3345872 RepID=UPI0036BAE2C4